MNDHAIKNELEKYLAALTGQPFDLLVGSYRRNEKVPVEVGCYGFIALNKGGDLVTVNDMPLKPFPPGFPDLSGETWGFVDPWRNLYKRPFQISFAGTGTAPLLVLVQVTKNS